MLRLVVLLLYLIAAYSAVQIKTGGGWDPNGQTAQPPPTGDIGGGWDPNGDLTGNLDPDG